MLFDAVAKRPFICQSIKVSPNLPSSRKKQRCKQAKKQNKTKQNKTKQNKTKQNKTNIILLPLFRVYSLSSVPPWVLPFPVG